MDVLQNRGLEKELEDHAGDSDYEEGKAHTGGDEFAILVHVEMSLTGVGPPGENFCNTFGVVTAKDANHAKIGTTLATNGHKLTRMNSDGGQWHWPPAPMARLYTSLGQPPQVPSRRRRQG